MGNAIHRLLHCNRNHSRASISTVKWNHLSDYLLSLVGYVIGLGNIWRFPYVTYDNGGGMFLLLYIFLLLTVAIPLLMIEMSIGQFSGMSVINAFGMVPAFQGIGVAQVLCSFLVSLYYVMFLVYTTKFFLSSFGGELPWLSCKDHSWANERCYVRSSEPCNGVNRSLPDNKRKNTSNVSCSLDTAPYQYWNYYILRRDPYDPSAVDAPHWELILILGATWIVIFFCIMRGIKTSGKVVYVTVILPYLLFICIAIMGCTLEGALDGILYLFIPKLKDVYNVKVWKAALSQLLFSHSLGLGGLLIYASFNRIHHKLHYVAIFLVVVDFLTSLLLSVVVFSVLGFLAKQLELEIKDVAMQGSDLIFIIYPEALGLMPVAGVWTTVFFFALYAVVIDTQFVLCQTVVDSIQEIYKSLEDHTPLVTLAVCCSSYLFGIIFTTKAGLWMVIALDKHVTEIITVYCLLWENIDVMYFYGLNRFSNNVHFMLGFSPPFYLKFLWAVFDPIVLMAGLFSTFVIEEQFITFRVNHLYWFSAITLVILLQIPVAAFYGLITSLIRKKNWKEAFRPNPKWGPFSTQDRASYEKWLENKPMEKDCMTEILNEFRKCLECCKCRK